MTHRSWTDRDGNLISQPTLTVEELKAIVDETHGWGRKVACHAYNGTGLKRALDGGCDSIEHGLEITDEEIAQMIKQGTWYVPTIAAVLRRLGSARYRQAVSVTASAWPCTACHSPRRCAPASRSPSAPTSVAFRGASPWPRNSAARWNSA